MVVPELARHRLYRYLEETMGHERATTLMELLPGVGWADVATKQDLDHVHIALRAELHTEIAGLRTEIAGVRDELHTGMAGLRTELHTEIAGLRIEVHTGMAGVRTELYKTVSKQVIAMAGTTAALIGTATAVILAYG